MNSSPSVLGALENEYIEIFRETAAAFREPVMLYSIGKGSTVSLHLDRKAFAPRPIPFPLHKDTTWKFKERISFRAEIAKEQGFKLLGHSNHNGIKDGITPFFSTESVYTKTIRAVAPRAGLHKHGFDSAKGGSSRDEVRSPAKERILSVRELGHRWDPRNHGPILRRTCCPKLGPDQTVRVPPISDSTELEVWNYTQRENFQVSLPYLARERPIVWQRSQSIMADDERHQLRDGGMTEVRKKRFRTLGCRPLTAGFDSDATTVEEVIKEVTELTLSELVSRFIDGDKEDSMEKKKNRGHF